jgi:capsular polysaccharide biosynthesis protein
VEKNNLSVTSEPEGSSNLYDIFLILRKRIKLILFLFIVAIALAGLLNFILPEIYEDKLLVAIPHFSQLSHSEAAPMISPDEVIHDIENLNGYKYDNYAELSRKLAIKESTAATIKKIAARALNDSRLAITIEGTNPALLKDISGGLLRYLNQDSYVSDRLSMEKAALIELENGLKEAIKREEVFKGVIEKDINAGKMKYLGFNPLSLEDHLLDLKERQNRLKNQIRLSRGFETTDEFVQQTPVRPKKILNIILAGFLSIGFGSLLAVVIDHIERSRKNKDQ